jgi:putative ABC transport system permease protein
LFTTFGASIKASLDASVKKSFGGDLVVNSGNFGRAGLSPRMATDIGRLPEVQTAVGLGAGGAKVAGKDERLTIANTGSLTRVLNVDVASGSLDSLGAKQLAVGKKLADDNGWKVGTVVPVTFADGASDTFTVGAVYKNTDVVSDLIITRAGWAPHAVQDADDAVLIGLRPGVPLAAGKAAVEGVAAAYGGPTVQDRSEYVASVAQGVNMILGLIYVLLFLAIVIAAMGIANTLSLSVYERTRELGVLRAVGQTQGQLRSMVRWESVIVSTFGAIGGLGVGVFLGWALVKAASAAENIGVFAVPAGQLLVILLLGAIVGVLAALRPARRAARMDVLAAVAAQ